MSERIPWGQLMWNLFRKPVLESEFEWTFSNTSTGDNKRDYRLRNFLRFYFDEVSMFTTHTLVKKGDFTLYLAKGDTIRVRRFTNGKTWVRYETENRYLEVEL